jgi:hypothetical protein
LVRNSISGVAEISAKSTTWCAKPAQSGVGHLHGALCGILLCFASGLVQGCYVYTPVTGAPAPTTYVALDITDRGRVGLGDLIGPAATRVEGVLQSQTDSAYALNVTSVGYLNGQSNRWSGEPLMVRKDFIGNLRERKFSRGRTALATGSAVGGILVFALTRGLFGFGGGSGGGGGDPAEQ